MSDLGRKRGGHRSVALWDVRNDKDHLRDHLYGAESPKDFMYHAIGHEGPTVHFAPFESDDPVDREAERWRVERERKELSDYIRAIAQIRTIVESRPERRGGALVMKGTSIALAQILAELADDQKLSEIGAEYGLKKRDLKKLMHGLAVYLERPFAR